MSLDIERLRASIDAQWRKVISGPLREYVRIPSVSPAFDAQWRAHGHIDAAIRLLADWCRARPIPDIQVEIRELAELTPLLLVEVPGEEEKGCIVVYGHLDKQPEMTGWAPGPEIGLSESARLGFTAAAVQTTDTPCSAR